MNEQQLIPLKIKKLTFNGFKGYLKSVSVDFSDEISSVIYGENGCGKTSFLKGLHYFLAQDEDGLKSLGIESIVCAFFHEKKEHEVTVSRYDDEDLKRYDWSAFNNSPLSKSASLSIGTERGIKQSFLKISPPDIYRCLKGSNLFIDDRSGLRMSEKRVFKSDIHHQALKELSNIIVKQIREMERSEKRFSKDNTYLFSNEHVSLDTINLDDMENLLMRHYLRSKNILKISSHVNNKDFLTNIFNTFSEIEGSTNDIKKIFEMKDENEEFFKDKLIEAISLTDKKSIIFIQNFMKIIDDFSNQKKRALLKEMEQNKPIDQLINYMNKYFIDDKELYISENDIHVKTKFGKHSISELSSGERNLLTFLSVILLKSSYKNFIIIDEPEISLSLNWKRNMIEVLEKLVPSAQIVVATHSTSIPPDEDNLCELNRDFKSCTFAETSSKTNVNQQLDFLSTSHLGDLVI